MQQMLRFHAMKRYGNIQNLKQILINLVYISFEQEDVIGGITGISSIDPVINEMSLKQHRLHEQTKVAKISAHALAKRTPQINSLVNNGVEYANQSGQGT